MTRIVIYESPKTFFRFSFDYNKNDRKDNFFDFVKFQEIWLSVDVQ